MTREEAEAVAARLVTVEDDSFDLFGTQDDAEREDQKERQRECTHGITFDEVQGLRMSPINVRRLWPRLFGPCPLGCGYSGIYYASWAHFIAGDW